ncbi:c-type cytochrome biogenesis protein CcmI [Oceanospirillum beijerinckii]|uniref:c-type cytochrome biogenesis protein CcmI n=1 Tax=Oceanospirillum beijerinckii TaxID=64976 RepID=UPI0004067C91|nr:c-type cytochrome biogenesis protein CcmI [Oceanospirillum beijerinckii]
MTTLWIGIAALTAMSAIFVLLPLVRKSNQASELTEAERTEQNVAMFRQRLAELENEQAMGNLRPDQFEQMKSELEQTLLDDVGDKDVPVLRSTRPGWLLSFALAALIATGSLGWYLVNGNAMALEMTMNRQDGQLPSVEEMTARLEKSLKENPDSAEGWYLLSRTYMNQGRFNDAVKALEEVLRIDGRQPAILAQYAQALFFASNNQMTVQVDAVLTEALQADPNEPAALGLRGIAAFEAGDYHAAIAFWQQSLPNMQDQNSVNALRSGIAEATRRLEAAGEKVDPALIGPRLQVEVTISDEMKANAKPEDTVFVFARSPAGGPPMPLAAARLTVADLPASITLDDSMAVAPMAKLSGAEQVNLVARVAEAGTPEPKAGDLQGALGPFPVTHQETIRLVISERIQ